jgi:hypothetical protein
MIIQDSLFLTTNEQDMVEEVILGQTPWSFNPHINFEREDKASFKSDHDTFQFVSDLMPIEHPAHILSSEIFQAFCARNKIAWDKIIRMKTNLMTQNTNTDYHAIHVDQDFPHKVFLYYVNDADGDTVFFDEFWEKGTKVIKEDLIEQIRVKPKKGLGVVFDGLQYHCSTSPQLAGYRCVINIDFI